MTDTDTKPGDAERLDDPHFVLRFMNDEAVLHELDLDHFQVTLHFNERQLRLSLSGNQLSEIREQAILADRIVVEPSRDATIADLRMKVAHLEAHAESMKRAVAAACAEQDRAWLQVTDLREQVAQRKAHHILTSGDLTAALARATKAEAEVERLRAVVEPARKAVLQIRAHGETCHELVTALAALVSPQPDAHPEDHCGDCGRNNPVWFAPNAIWNLVMGTQEAMYDPGGIICPMCFIRRAEARGITPPAWELRPEGSSPQPDAPGEDTTYQPGWFARDVRLATERLSRMRLSSPQTDAAPLGDSAIRHERTLREHSGPCGASCEPDAAQPEGSWLKQQLDDVKRKMKDWPDWVLREIQAEVEKTPLKKDDAAKPVAPGWVCNCGIDRIAHCKATECRASRVEFARPSAVAPRPVSAQDWRVLLASLRQFGPSQDGAVERDLEAAIERAVAPQPSGDGWQDIATAPKDGTRVLTWTASDANHHEKILHYDADLGARGLWAEDNNEWFVVAPSYWRPLPAPPALDQEGEG